MPVHVRTIWLLAQAVGADFTLLFHARKHRCDYQLWRDGNVHGANKLEPFFFFCKMCMPTSKVHGYRSKHPSGIRIEFGFEWDAKISLLLRTDFKDPPIPVFLGKSLTPNKLQPINGKKTLIQYAKQPMRKHWGTNSLQALLSPIYTSMHIPHNFVRRWRFVAITITKSFSV